MLVDTSSWIEGFRSNGRFEVRERVSVLMRSGQAVWCDAVRLELWNGRSGPQEQKRLREIDQVIPNLAIDSAMWELSRTLSRRARSAGLTIPAMDLLIAACASHHGAAVESCDIHFRELDKLQLPPGP